MRVACGISSISAMSSVCVDRSARGRLPEHVGLILDGNRRYAREQGFSDPSQAYQMGAQKLDDVLMWCN